MKKQKLIDYWKIIRECKWDIDHNPDRIKEELLKKYNLDVRARLAEFCWRRQKELYVLLEDYSEAKTGFAHNYFPVSDDDFNDLTAHIVGLGKEEFKKVKKDPEAAMVRAENEDYHENFFYSFQWEDYL